MSRKSTEHAAQTQTGARQAVELTDDEVEQVHGGESTLRSSGREPSSAKGHEKEIELIHVSI
jgi:hypothetical protein